MWLGRRTTVGWLICAERVPGRFPSLIPGPNPWRFSSSSMPCPSSLLCLRIEHSRLPWDTGFCSSVHDGRPRLDVLSCATPGPQSARCLAARTRLVGRPETGIQSRLCPCWDRLCRRGRRTVGSLPPYRVLKSPALLLCCQRCMLSVVRNGAYRESSQPLDDRWLSS